MTLLLVTKVDVSKYIKIGIMKVSYLIGFAILPNTQQRALYEG